MPSLRSRLLKFMVRNGHLLRIRLRKETADWNDRETILRYRAQCEEGARRFGVIPPEVRVKPVMVDGLHAEWILPVHAAGDRTMMFFHGGGYVSGSCADHRVHAARMVRGTNARALLFGYRLAPEHTFPAALDDSVKTYRWMLDHGMAASHVVFVGDSAGGGLCLAALLALRDRSIPLPSAVVALSPWTDLTCSGQSYLTNAERCLFPEGAYNAFSRHYAGEYDPKTPLMSPLYGDLHGLPPMLVYVGGDEILLDDAVRFARKARDAGVDVTLRVGRGQFHCFPLCAPLFPEAVWAMSEICDFIQAHMQE